MVVIVGFVVVLGAFGFFVGFGALGFLVGFGGFGFLVGFGAFCFFALASFSAAFFALASESLKEENIELFETSLQCLCVQTCMKGAASFFKHFIVGLYELLLPNVSLQLFFIACLLGHVYLQQMS